VFATVVVAHKSAVQFLHVFLGCFAFVAHAAYALLQFECYCGAVGTFVTYAESRCLYYGYVDVFHAVYFAVGHVVAFGGGAQVYYAP